MGVTLDPTPAKEPPTMAHVDDLTLVSAAQLQETDELYVGRPSDPADPDRRTLLGSLAGFMGENLPDDTDFLDALISRIIGPGGALPLTSGSFEPAYAPSAGVSSVSYQARVGRFIRLGPLVLVFANVQTTAVSGASGDARISGLPFTATSSGVWLLNLRTVNMAIGSGEVPYAYARSGEKQVSFARMRSGTSISVYTAADWANNGGVIISGIYETDDP